MSDYQPVELEAGGAGTSKWRDEELEEYGGKYKKKVAVGQVTIRLPLDPNPLNLLAIAYGFLPWIIPGSFIVHSLLTQRFISIYSVAITAVVTVLNEAILKPILKQPRPPQTANRDKEGNIKPGMPSGHVFNAYATMVWALLEVGFRGPGLDEEHQQLTFEWLALILLCMFPVPWARWYNLDHTAGQCATSIVLGTIVGSAAFYIRITQFPHHWKYWDCCTGNASALVSTITAAANGTADSSGHHGHHGHHGNHGHHGHHGHGGD